MQPKKKKPKPNDPCPCGGESHPGKPIKYKKCGGSTKPTALHLEMFPPPRFNIGARVMCSVEVTAPLLVAMYGNAVYLPGVVVKHEYIQPDWKTSVPYQVRLIECKMKRKVVEEGEELIIVPVDDDVFIKLPTPEDIMHDELVQSWTVASEKAISSSQCSCSFCCSKK